MTLAVKWAEIGPTKNGPVSVSYTTYGASGNSTRERNIRVSFADLETAIIQCLGYSWLETISGGTPYRLRRELPEFFPFESPTFAYMCKTVNVYQFEKWFGRSYFSAGVFGPVNSFPNPDPIGDEFQKLNIYKNACLKLTYEATAYNSYASDAWMADAGFAQDESKRFCSFRYTQQAKYFSVPGLTFHAITGVAPSPSVPYPVGLIESKGTLTITWHCVSWEAVPINTHRNAIGKVNSVDFNFYGKKYAPGTLLCLAPQYNTYVMSNGVLGCDVVFTFEEFTKEHNRILYKPNGSDTIGYYWLITDPTIVAPPVYGALPPNKTLFGEIDFKDLFNVSLT